MGCQESNKMKSHKAVIDLDQELDFLNRFAWKYQQQIKSFEQSERLDRFIQKRYNYLYIPNNSILHEVWMHYI